MNPVDKVSPAAPEAVAFGPLLSRLRELIVQARTQALRAVDAILVNGVKEIKRHIAGKTVPGAISTELRVPDVRLIREAAHVSQSQFAKLIGVNLRTLQNWSNIASVLPGRPGRCSKSWRPTPKAIKALHT